MFNKLKTLITGGAAGSRPVQTGGAVPAGYFMPKTASELLSVPQRKLLLRQIWDNTSLPEEVYNRLYLDPLKELAECVQNVPASEEGEWGREGGYLDLTLKFTACSVRLAKGHMFPPGAAPEEQAAKNTLWNAVVFWAALTAHMPLLTRLDGELSDGRCWMPGMARPPAPFRFRLRDTKHCGTATVMAARLLPADGILWLSGDRRAMQVMAALACGEASVMPLIKEILDKSRDVACSPAVSSAVPLPAADAPFTTTELVPAVTAPVISSVVIQTAGMATEIAAGLTSSIEPESATLQPQLDSEAELLSSALSDDAGIENEQPKQEIQESDDDTALLLSMFTAVESVETQTTDEKATNDSPACSLISAEDSAKIMPAETEIGPLATELQIIPETIESDQSERGNLAPTDVPEAVKLQEFSEPSGIIPISEPCENQNAGERLLTWLKESINNKALSVNESDSMLHAVSGFMFISLPGAIFKFIEETGIEEDRKSIQSSFEKTGVLHMRNDKRFFKVRVFESEGLEGKYQKRSGYLIKLSAIYMSGAGKIKDSRYILIEN